MTGDEVEHATERREARLVRLLRWGSTAGPRVLVLSLAAAAAGLASVARSVNGALPLQEIRRQWTANALHLDHEDCRHPYLVDRAESLEELACAQRTLDAVRSALFTQLAASPFSYRKAGSGQRSTRR